MSASLVGSEMCIRDRHKPEAGSRCPTRPAAAAADATGTPRSDSKESTSCLLYTSDAADDM
eukprot:1520013-Alexandrium_andersonii.AAC.1